MRDRVFKTGLDVRRILRAATAAAAMALAYRSLFLLLLHHHHHLLSCSCETCIVHFSATLRSVWAPFSPLRRAVDSTGIIHIRSFLLTFFSSLPLSVDRSRVSVGAPRDIEWFIDLFCRRSFIRRLSMAFAYCSGFLSLSLSRARKREREREWSLLLQSDPPGQDSSFFILPSARAPACAMNFVVILTRVLFMALYC